MPAPDAMTDNYSITEDQLLVGSANGFLNNDSDPDGDPLSIILIDGLPFSFGTPITLASGANLTINADGSFQYDQNGSFTYLSAGQTVNDIFTYTISDGRFGFDTSAVCVTISGVTQGPPPTGVLHIEKDASVPGGTADVAGETINYTLAVTNTGNAAIANVVVDDPFTTNEAPVLSGGFNVGDTDQDNLLDVGETWQYTASHHGDAGRAGRRDSHRQHGDGDRHRGDLGHATTRRLPVAQSKILHIEKDATVPGGTANSTSDVINYTLAVTNQGNAAIANVVVDDPFTTNEAPVLIRRLQHRRHRPGQSVGCRRDLAVHGQPSGDAGRARRRDRHRQHGDGDRHRGDPGQRRRDGAGGAEQDPAHREGRDGCGRHGERRPATTISYTLAVTNQGNAAIANVVVDDPFTTNEAPVLIPAPSISATPTRTICWMSARPGSTRPAIR